MSWIAKLLGFEREVDCDLSTLSEVQEIEGRLNKVEDQEIPELDKRVRRLERERDLLQAS
jgi:hypothetical protein